MQSEAYDDKEIWRLLGGHKQDINNLKGWQKSQNGSLHRMEERIEKMDEKIDNRLDSLHRLIIGTLLTALTSVLIWVIDKVVM